MDYNSPMFESAIDYISKGRKYHEPKSGKEYMEPVKYRKDLEMITGPLWKL